ncbi:MAG: hypothetical protein JW797_20215 [Bradymonadales bacterium]|nr:hypothetical protein [Bradymonadales bacterium]
MTIKAIEVKRQQDQRAALRPVARAASQAEACLFQYDSSQRNSLRIRSLAWPPLFLLCVLFHLTGCLDQDVEVTGPQADASDSQQGSLLVVALEEQEVTVELETLPSQPGGDGTQRVIMASAIQAGYPAVVLADWIFDMVAEDGFRTSNQGEGCEPLPADRTSEAWIELVTRDVGWDPALNMRGCYKPRNLSRIELMAHPGGSTGE